MADATKDRMVEGRTDEYPVPKSKKGNTFLFLGVGLFLVILVVIGGIFLFAPGLISKEAAERVKDRVRLNRREESMDMSTRWNRFS